MVNHFAHRFGLEQDSLTPEEIAEAETRVRDRFGTPAWIHYLP
jgi:hypothetical protein